MHPSTILRLELCGKLSAARLAASLQHDCGLSFRRVCLWTDSTAVLRWINSSSYRFSPYVGARIGEILELTRPEQWNHVHKGLNPVDDASRGLSPQELHQTHRWFSGTEFLTRTPDDWPVTPLIAPFEESDPEIKSAL